MTILDRCKTPYGMRLVYDGAHPILPGHQIIWRCGDYGISGVHLPIIHEPYECEFMTVIFDSKGRNHPDGHVPGLCDGHVTVKCDDEARYFLNEASKYLLDKLEGSSGT